MLESLLFVENGCFPKLTQDSDRRLCPVGRSKLSQSIIPTEKQSMKRSVIERLEKVKDIVISYILWISRKMEENVSLTVHYCTGIDRNNDHMGMPPPEHAKGTT